jgi:hypothetical protein
MDFLMYFGSALVIAFIISTFKWFKHNGEVKKQLKREWERQELISKTTWLCPRCQGRVPNESNKCACGQPIHNIGRR